MYVIGEQSALAEQWVTRLQHAGAQLLEGMQPAAEVLEMAAGAPLDSHLAHTFLYLVEAGRVELSLNGRNLFFLSAGDVLNLAPLPKEVLCQYRAAAPLRLHAYERSHALAHIIAAERVGLLTEYVSGQAWLLAEAVTRWKPADLQGANDIRQFAAGEVLIRQGDTPDHVFIIVEGYAEAFVDGVKVGDVTKEEIFGAMAIFTQEQRTATVVASTACTVASIPCEQFMALLATDPGIAHSLIESMARKINHLNQQLTRPGN